MKKGFTLIEILAALAIMAILMLAFVQFFGGTLRVSSELQVQNELLNEGQVAHQLIASRIKEAWYVWPPGSSLELAHTGWTTQNTFDGSHTWTVGPFFLAMILPPLKDGVTCSSSKTGCFRFFAYYPMRRQDYVANASVTEALEPDPRNDPNVWVLMEYRAYYRHGGVADCPVEDGDPDPTNTAYRGRQGRFLVDDVQPTTDPWDSTYDYPAIFSYQTSGGTVQAVSVQLRFARESRKRVYRVPASPGTLTLTIEPRNQGILAHDDGAYCQ